MKRGNRSNGYICGKLKKQLYERKLSGFGARDIAAQHIYAVDASGTREGDDT